MASYDSDSSLDDQTEYTETSVLLGYASKEATEDAISHLGGVPVSTSPSSANHPSLLITASIDMARTSVLAAG